MRGWYASEGRHMVWLVCVRDVGGLGHVSEGHDASVGAVMCRWGL